VRLSHIRLLYRLVEKLEGDGHEVVLTIRAHHHKQLIVVVNLHSGDIEQLTDIRKVEGG